ncbi:hypothetical protein ACJJTC_014282 [Scirpophaga incertulas]
MQSYCRQLHFAHTLTRSDTYAQKRVSAGTEPRPGRSIARPAHSPHNRLAACAAAKPMLSWYRELLLRTTPRATDSLDNLSDVTECLSDVNNITQDRDKSVFLVGDFNAHSGKFFNEELSDIWNEKHWR